MKRETRISILSAALGSAATIAAIWAFELHPDWSRQQYNAISMAKNVRTVDYPDVTLHIDRVETRRGAAYVRQGGDVTRYGVFHTGTPVAPAGDLHPLRIIPEDGPPVLPIKFFGYGNVPVSAARRAFFEDGEEVHIVSEGDTLLGRFRILKINNASIDFEEVGSGRRGQKMLEDQGPA